MLPTIELGFWLLVMLGIGAAGAWHLWFWLNKDRFR